MSTRLLSRRAFAFVAGIALLAFGGWAAADPPSRVARLGYMTGSISFSPAGESDWVHATLNRPLSTGDRLWADPGARGEIEIGGATVRMSADSGVSILNLDDRIAQLQLTQGTLNVRVRRLARNEYFEVDTPNLAFTMRKPGEFRIHVNPEDDTTTIVVRKGQGEAYGEGAAYVIDSRRPYRFAGTGLRDYRELEAARLDDFDRWSSERDRRYDTSVSLRYVSPDVIGYSDLDEHGSWRADATYGHVWYPSRVSADWAPYRDGHWAWIDPWGWTWVDDAPWGFAVSHYGRWANLRGTWGWVPGPLRSRAYYAPALVAFVGGDNFQLTISTGAVGGVAWFPLAPREVYRPSYTVSRTYFENVNRSNTVVTNTVINNYYNSNVTNVTYVNQQVPGAIVAVPTTAFVQSQPVSRAAVRVSQATIAAAPAVAAPRAAPTERSVRGAAAQAGKPPERAFQRPVVARSAPPAAPAGFAAQQAQLAAKPGKPLDAEARRQLKPAASAPAPVVNVIARTQAAATAIRPLPAAPTAGRDEARAKPQQAGKAPVPAPRAASQPREQTAQPAKPQPLERQAQPAKPQPREQQAQPAKPQPREQQAQPAKPQPREQQAQPAKPQPREQQAQPAKPQPREQQAQPAKPQPLERQAQPAKPQPREAQAAKAQEQRAQPSQPAQPVARQPLPRGAEPVAIAPSLPGAQKAVPAEPRGQRAAPATAKARDKKKDDEEKEAQEEARKQKR